MIVFLTANEICDRFASSGFHANMITYLTEVLNMPLVPASNTLTNFSGTASFTPLIGALIADSFAGRFWTIIVGSIIYELVSLFLLFLEIKLSQSIHLLKLVKTNYFYGYELHSSFALLFIMEFRSLPLNSYDDSNYPKVKTSRSFHM